MIKKQNQSTILEGSIITSLLQFAVPILLSLVFQAAYSSVDMMIIGRYGDAAGITAVGVGGAIITTISTVMTSLSTGVSVTVGQGIGAGDKRYAEKTIGTAVSVFTVLSLVIGCLLFIGAEKIINALQTPEEAVEGAVAYLKVCSFGILFIIVYNVVSSIIRGLGNSSLPLLFVIISCVANIFGDLLLVGRLNMGVKGAALATVGAQGLSAVLSIVMLGRGKKLPVHLAIEDINLDKGIVSHIFRIGTPLALQSLLGKGSFLIISSFIYGMGLVASAGYSVAEKLISFIMLVPSALMNSISAYVAQNVGANNHKRASSAVKTGILLGLGAGTVLFCLGFFASGSFAKLFNDDPEVIEQAADYMRGFSADCLLGCIHFSLIGYLNGYGKTLPVLIQGITSAFLVRVPFSYFARIKTGSLVYMGMATPVSTLYGVVFFSIVILAYKKKGLFQNRY